VEQVGDQLQIVGKLPGFAASDGACDLIRQYESARKSRRIGKQRTGKDSPHIQFANADNDEKLIAFVRSFGPVVASSAEILPLSTYNKRSGRPEAGQDEDPPLIVASQDMQELRSERFIYRAALALVLELVAPLRFDFLKAQVLIGDIAEKIVAWPWQWERERSQRHGEPIWKVTPESLRRIRELSSFGPDMSLPKTVDAGIVVCELLNVFRAAVFPNHLEMHSGIRWGIRPLLYSILRREFLYPHEVGICANSQCRDFFEIERSGQKFCCSECSLKQRQREYWSRRGKTLRKERLKAKTK
jgi:hypothetical protein